MHITTANGIKLEYDYDDDVDVAQKEIEAGLRKTWGAYHVTFRNGQLFAEPEQWRLDEPTQKQLDYLNKLGYTGNTPLTKGQASDLIERQKDLTTPSCHYCGQPATGFGFFDEPCCSECGG